MYSKKQTLLALATAVTAMIALPGGADAFWASSGSRGSSGSSGSYGSSGSHGSSGSWGSSGSHGSSGSSGSWGSSASHGSSGSHGGFFRRRAMRRASHGSSGSSGSHASSGSHGSSASHGSSGSHGSHVSYYSSAGSHGSHASSHGGWATTTHSSSHVVASSPVVTSSRVVASSPVVRSTGSGMLSVTVPADATVYVNDNKTTSTGTQRQYVSHGLAEGQGYTYRVRVEFERDGQLVTESKTVRLTAGANESMDFSAPEAPMVADDESDEEDEESVTKLTLRVPENARVTLAGAVTKQTGAEREFLTTKLAAGATWEDYTIRVEAEVNGEQLVQERTITLRGGETQAMIFNFAPAQIASVN